MTSKMQHLTDGTIELVITIPWAEVQKTYDAVVDNTVKNAELSGFRKGKAPRNLVEEKPDKTKVDLGSYKEAIRDVKVSKQKKIWVPGSGEAGSGSARQNEGKPDDKKPTLEELLKAC